MTASKERELDTRLGDLWDWIGWKKGYYRDCRPWPPCCMALYKVLFWLSLRAVRQLLDGDTKEIGCIDSTSNMVLGHGYRCCIAQCQRYCFLTAILDCYSPFFLEEINFNI